MKPNRKWEYTIFILVALALKLSLTPSITIVDAQSSKDVHNINQLTVAQVKAYVHQRTIELGGDPVKTDWIIGHESEYCYQTGYYDPSLSGDDGISIGCWQFNLSVHSDKTKPDYISKECAADFFCSTDVAIHWINGKDHENANAWSTWKNRFKWYSAQNPPQ